MSGVSAALLKRELIIFGTAVMFLTRIPVGRYCSGEPSTLSVSTRYFPLVGWVVGGLISLCFLVSDYFLPHSLSVALTLWAGVLLTGAFHEDGLADVADSAGAFTLERKLDIMRDSRVGTYGSLALILLILIKFIAILEVALISVPVTVAALLVAHILSRWSSVWMMATQVYARPEAANRVVAQGVNSSRLMQATGCAAALLLPVAAMSSWWILVCMPIAWVISHVSAYRYRRAYTGITGDCLGATNQLVETGIYVVIVAMFS